MVFLQSNLSPFLKTEIRLLAWSHDFMGYGPSSLGGFVEDKQALSLGVTMSKGDALSTSLNYVMQMGERKANLARDKDYLAASVSYAF